MLPREWASFSITKYVELNLALRPAICARCYHLPVFKPSHSQPAFPQKDIDPKNGSRNITFSERLNVRGSARLLATQLEAAAAPATAAPAGNPPSNSQSAGSEVPARSPAPGGRAVLQHARPRPGSGTASDNSAVHGEGSNADCDTRTTGRGDTGRTDSHRNGSHSQSIHSKPKPHAVAVARLAPPKTRRLSVRPPHAPWKARGRFLD